MSIGTGMVIAAILLLGNAFFVGAEFAVTSSRKSQIDPLVEEGRAGAKAAQWALEHVSLMLAVCQLGVTLASTALGAVAEPAIARAVHPLLSRFGFAAATSHLVAVVVALLVVLYLHVVVGEMIPKNLSVSAPAKMVLIMAPVLVKLARLVRPIVEGMDHFANWVIKLCGVEPKHEVAATFTAEEVATIVELSEAEGKLHDDLGLLSGTLEFSEELVGSVMVPPQRLVTLPVDVTPAAFEKVVSQTGFSRFPLVNEQGEYVGYLHLKDVLNADSRPERERPIPSWWVRALPTASPQDEVEDALRIMQRTGVHLAKVADHGQIVGVIFLEDILEELVGEVRDVIQRQ
ncbi:hypothetical protein HMPREF3152_04425 [Actinomyces sp. HMSC06A08]|nr:hypothetical protein HMPREF3152_04425 [Actinomyces sp. HMSC06A08]